MKPRRVTILRKGLLVLALPLIYQALFIGLLLKRQYDHNGAQIAAVHTKDVLLQADRVQRLLILSQSNLRAFLLTSRDDFSKQLISGSEEIKRELATLEAMVADNPKQQERFAKVATRARERIQYEHDMVELMRQGNREELQRHLQNLTGQPVMDAFSQEIEAFRDSEEKLDARRLEELAN